MNKASLKKLFYPMKKNTILPSLKYFTTLVRDGLKLKYSVFFSNCLSTEKYLGGSTST